MMNERTIDRKAKEAEGAREEEDRERERTKARNFSLMQSK